MRDTESSWSHRRALLLDGQTLDSRVRRHLRTR